jgi:hypothetical protein
LSDRARQSDISIAAIVGVDTEAILYH